MNAAAKGARNERRSMAVLESAGYRCTRSAASLGAWDIIGISHRDVVLCQVKTRDWPGSGGDGDASRVYLTAHLPQDRASLATSAERLPDVRGSFEGRQKEKGRALLKSATPRIF